MRTKGRGVRLVFGPLLALIAGLGVSLGPDWLARTFDLLHSPYPYIGYIPALIIGVSLLLAAAGAWLMRSWWSALMVPVIYFAGYMLGALLDLRLNGSAYDPSYFTLAAEVFAAIFLTPLLLVTLLATAISRRLARPASVAGA